MNKKFFSIIIPVFNVNMELFSFCLESVLSQDYEDFEILIIDDGSSVKYGSEYKNLSNIDARIKYHYKKNGGVSSARNIGIGLSAGEWILFMDADDWIDKDALSNMKNIIGQSKAEIIFFGYFKNFSNKEFKIISSTYNDKEIIFTKPEKSNLQKKIIAASVYGEPGAKATIFRSVWSVAFKHTLFLDGLLKFQENLLIGEDLIFRLHTSEKAKIVQYSNYCYYHYRNNPQSASCKYRKKAEENSLAELNGIKFFIEEYSKKELQEAYGYRIVEIMTVLVKRCYFHKDNTSNWLSKRKRAKKFYGSKFVKSNVSKEMIRKLPIKRKVQFYLLRKNMFTFYLGLMKLSNKI